MPGWRVRDTERAQSGGLLVRWQPTGHGTGSTVVPFSALALSLVHAGFLRRAEDSPYLERYCDAHDVKVRKKGWWGATQVPCAHNGGGREAKEERDKVVQACAQAFSPAPRQSSGPRSTMHVRKAGRGQWSRMLSASWPAAAARTQQGTIRRLGLRGARGSARGQVRRQHEPSAAQETPQEHTDLRGDVAYEDLGAILARRHRGGGVRPVADLHARPLGKEEAFPR